MHITIQNNLQLKSLINKINTKANQIPGFLRRNLEISNTYTKPLVYKTFARPLLEHASSVMDTHDQEGNNLLDRTQRLAARCASGRYRRSSCVEEILADLEWETLAQRRRHTRLTNFYKYHNKHIHISSKYAPAPTQVRRSRKKNNSQA